MSWGSLAGSVRDNDGRRRRGAATEGGGGAGAAGGGAAAAGGGASGGGEGWTPLNPATNRPAGLPHRVVSIPLGNSAQ